MLADTRDRRELPMAMQFVRACISSALAILTVAHAVTPAVLFAASAVFAGDERARGADRCQCRASVGGIAFVRSQPVILSFMFVAGGPQLGQFELGLIASLWSTEASALTGGIGALGLVAAMALNAAVRRFTLPSAPVAAR